MYSAPCWHPSGTIIYYSRKPKYPNKKGSKFYDIYSYNLKTEKEHRLTTDNRAYNPIYIPKDSSIAYLATYDGGQDLYILDLKTKSSKKVTDFDQRPMISHLNYDAKSHSIFFDITFNHFRDIYN